VVLYPNPARNKLVFSINLKEATPIKIEIYNVLGQTVKTLCDETLKSGNHSVQWDFRDNKNHRLTQGAYFYRITTNQGTKTGKVLLIE